MRVFDLYLMRDFSYLMNSSPAFIEQMYVDYQQNPSKVDPEFRSFFAGFDFAVNNNSSASSISTDEFKVYDLIRAYRNKGHLIAKTNPLKPRKDRQANLELAHFGLQDADLDKSFVIGSAIGLPNASLREILERLQTWYCGQIGFEYAMVRNSEELQFLRERIENNARFQFSIDKKERIFRKLNQAVVFEKFLGTKYIGEKRFSLEGGETTVPALDAIIQTAAEKGAEEIVIGMAHRGRLNLLANIMGKTYEEIFNEFEGNIVPDSTMGDGDVKYHMGYSSQYPTQLNQQVYVKLMPNPSHLEAVNPVVEGFTRAKADVIYQSDFTKILPITIHGDAAVAGQGIVYEVTQMAALPGYATGGTIHFVINNQIGFTTNFDDARSSDYCTSIASITNSPVIHVNGDSIEDVVFACELATEYRQRFGKDFWIDMVCYRKHGHNESDDPKYTQPGLYKLIEKHANPRDIYTQKLHSEGSLSADLAKKMEKEFWDDLQARLEQVKQHPLPYKPQPNELAWQSLTESGEVHPQTGISRSSAKVIIEGLIRVPEGFTPLRKISKYLEERRSSMQENKTVDWAAAELMAYGSLLLEGKHVRMSGQDVKRGTFSHRHAVLFDENTDAQYNRLNHLSEQQGKFHIYNSHLSEYGVLGFEYGYSIASPDNLVIWEAQFGDFSNGAQIMIDQFIVSAESKWQRNTGMMLLLPHGYEGQGPEHSSARLERFLQLCAEDNMTVVNITDPANFFHAIRRQLCRNFRKPLIVMSPKSLLRHPKCVSPIDAILEKTSFREVIDDSMNEQQAASVRKVLLCSGRIYFDLIEERNKRQANDIAIVRLEQLYPLRMDKIRDVLARYTQADWTWVQDEPQNMGAWNFLLAKFWEVTGETNMLSLVSRKNSASPATGFKKQHVKEQADIFERAFA